MYMLRYRFAWFRASRPCVYMRLIYIYIYKNEDEERRDKSFGKRAILHCCPMFIRHLTYQLGIVGYTPMVERILGNRWTGKKRDRSNILRNAKQSGLQAAIHGTAISRICAKCCSLHSAMCYDQAIAFKK